MSVAPPTAGESSKPRQSEAADDPHRQRILVIGGRKSGKSSCIKTVFQNVPVKDVAYFGVTQKVEKIDYDSIIPLQIWDTPSAFELDQLDVPLSSFSTLIFVMDMQQDDAYHESILRFVPLLLRSYLANPHMHYAVFIHKAEVLSEDYRGENFAEIQRAFAEELEDYPYPTLQSLSTQLDFSDPHTTGQIIEHLQGEVRFDMTSVHDVTLRDAWGKVVQETMEMLPEVEQLLFSFNATSGMDNSYLFDVNSRVVVASNGGKNDATLDLVTDYLGRFLQFRELYGSLRRNRPEGDLVDGLGGTAVPDGEKTNATQDDERPNGGGPEEDELEESGWWNEEDPNQPWTFQATRLLPNTTIAYWQFTPQLALVVLLRTEVWYAQRGMIEYNLTFLRKGVRRILMEL